MNRIEELIKRYCPDGVEWKRVGEIFNIRRGSRLTKSQLTDSGKYAVYHGSKDTPLGYYDKYNVTGDTVIVVNTGGIGGVKYCSDNFWCSDGSFWIEDLSNVNNKFLYYFLSQYERYFYNCKREGGVPTIDKAAVENVTIPIPPLSEQQHIVGILDKFDSLTSSLADGIPAEIRMRRQQYEYYRDYLFGLLI